MELVTPHLKSVLKNYQHSATKSLHGPGLSLVPSKEILSPDLNDELDFVQPPALPFPIQQLPILTTADTSRSERTETILEGESISCFVVGGEKRLCLPQVLNSVLREFSLHQINQECDHLQIYCSRCTPEQLNELKSTGILPHSAPSCGLITKTDAERLCSALLHAATSLHQAAASLRPLPPKGSTPFKVYHECFGKCAGLCTPELFTERGAARCIECVECQGMFTPPQFVCHAHRELENRTCHWGFDSNNWRAYLYVNKEQAECEKYEKALDALKEQLEAGPPAHLVACEVNGNNNHKRKQIHLLDPELVVKGEPLDIPLKKSKLEEYAAYIYAATMDPLYIHTAMYEQYFSRNLNAAYRPIPSIFPSGKEKRHCPVVPSTLGGRYKDPPVLQHPERVVPVSDTERFERSFQPNVALAPPTIPRKRYKDQTISDNLVQVKIEPEQYIVKTTDHHPPLDDDDDLISPSVISTIQPDDNNRHIVDSTVSVVQPVALHPRYNSEIELSTDTDDSLSELSDHQKDDKVQQITDLLVNVPNETTAKVLDLVRQIAKENHRIQQENHAKDERIKALELKLLELQPIHTTIIATTTHHSDYEVVTSSRTEITDDSVDESAQTTTTTTRDDIKSVITTATKTDDLAIIIKEEPE